MSECGELKREQKMNLVKKIPLGLNVNDSIDFFKKEINRVL